ncbi:hypothetical protein WA026_004807 [Henosepilachna vigintioctopunctata]|uniref:SKP1 component POZ domain-containing protein n=1 Tax=Henosepilachna vigintioctopunctata TaxID=420089 RepID=A0AAW1UTP9_9CUCU
MPIVKFRTSDGILFEVDLEVIKCSKVLLTMFQLLGTDDEEIPIPNITSSIFERVIQWGTYRRFVSRVTEASSLGEFQHSKITFRHDLFVDVSIHTLYVIMQAAVYLEIDDLRNLISRAIAHVIEETSVKDLRKLFNI